MIITIPWLKEHLKTNAKESEIIDQLTNIGLEVEGIKENSGEMGKFKIAKVLKTEKHPNADKLKVCDVTIGGKEILKVVCGAPNAREGLITIYAPPGAVIPKNNFELKGAKIRGVESKGMLCSESELNLSDESDGIIELKNKEREIGKSYFKKNSQKAIDISITPIDLLTVGYGSVIGGDISLDSNPNASLDSSSGSTMFFNLNFGLGPVDLLLGYRTWEPTHKMKTSSGG